MHPTEVAKFKMPFSVSTTSGGGVRHSLYKQATSVCDILKSGNFQDIPPFVLAMPGNKSTPAPVLYLELTGALRFLTRVHQIT